MGVLNNIKKGVKNVNWVKVGRNVLGIAAVGTFLIQPWVEKKEQEKLIEEKINKAVDERLK